MNDFDKWNGQYRRPQPHFTAEEKSSGIRPTIDRRRLITGSAMLGAMALVLTLAVQTANTQDAPDASPVRADSQMTANADCQVIQHLTYTPCGHQMTRRVALPADLTGQTRETITAAYGDYQVTSFSAGEIVMEQSLPMFCPEHIIIQPSESGMLCLFENRYGDALGLIRETGVQLGDLPESIQQEVRTGKGFASQDEAEKWLESIDS